MAAKSKQEIQNRSRKDDSALQRVLCLPVVNSACSSLQKTYATTKESHPLLVSVCEAYGKGIQSASSLAMWSVKPVVRKLEPQLAMANVLACRGLDHLEQRIPALHKPVEEVTSELKDSLYTHVQGAMHSVADALDRILGLATESCEQVQNTVREVAKDVKSSRMSHLAGAGAEAAIGRVEKLADHLLPQTEHNSGAHVSREASLSSIFGRIRSLANIVSQHAYRQTAQAIQHTREKGQEWAMWIPHLGGLTRQSSTKAQQVFSDTQNTASSWLKQRQVPEKEERKKNEDGRPSKAAEMAPSRSLVDSLTQSLQAAYLAIIFGVKEAPSAARNAAGRLLHLSAHKAASETSTQVGTLWGILQDVTSSLLGTVIHFVPVPRLLVKEEGTATTDGVKTLQRQESNQPMATNTQERGAPYQLRGDSRSNRGHHPLSFLNFDELPLPQPASFQHRSPAFEVDSTGARRSAFSPYKEAAGSRRLSEGLYHPSPEPVYGRAHHAGLYGTVLKKD